MKAGAQCEEFGTAVRQCKVCGKINDEMMKCPRCKTFYCGLECQAKDWNEGGDESHKAQCSDIKVKMNTLREKTRKAAQAKVDQYNSRLVAEELTRQGLSSS